jgi:signal transduction histidine kinase
VLDAIGKAIKAQEDVHRLFQDVREYAGPMQLELELFDLGDAFRSAWTQLAAQRMDRNIRLIAETSSSDLECRADCFRLEQVFRNLLENALAACKDPVELKVHWSHAQLGGQPAVRFVLQDNGTGLSVEVQEKLFEPFFESHGGRIVAANGQSGAEFIITLPRKLIATDCLEKER